MKVSKRRAWQPARRGISIFMILFMGAVPINCKRDDLSSGPKLSGGGASDPGNGSKPQPPPTPAPLGSLILNEVMVKNTSTLEDEEGNFPPWIEIYNTTEDRLDLSGIPLTDDLINPNKWKIPAGPDSVIPPGGFFVVYLDGKADTLGGYHANFTIPPEGEFTIMVNKSSKFTYDGSRLEPDESSGRLPDGKSGIFVTSEPTPGEPNIGPAEGKFIRGDVNESGSVNLTDMLLITKVLAGTERVPECQDRLDANDDGIVSEADSLFLGQELYKEESLINIPPPFLNPGTDPTPDDLPCPRR